MLYPTIGVPMIGKNLLYWYPQYQYTRCLRRAGAMVQLLELHAFEGAVTAAMEQCDGFLFPGGPDIQPEQYGQKRLSVCREPDSVRDDFEMMLLAAALAAGKPLLGIGRGMQLLNVALGGTLIQDIRLKQEYQHLDFFHRNTATHPLEIVPGSLLEELFDTDVITVNSLHHQVIDEVGKGLWVIGDSPEGYAEAVQIRDYPFGLAVQWHPEYMTSRTPVQQRLFQAFVDACRQNLPV